LIENVGLGFAAHRRGNTVTDCDSPSGNDKFPFAYVYSCWRWRGEGPRKGPALPNPGSYGSQTNHGG